MQKELQPEHKIAFSMSLMTLMCAALFWLSMHFPGISIQFTITSIYACSVVTMAICFTWALRLYGKLRQNLSIARFRRHLIRDLLIIFCAPITLTILCKLFNLPVAFWQTAQIHNLEFCLPNIFFLLSYLWLVPILLIANTPKMPWLWQGIFGTCALLFPQSAMFTLPTCYIFRLKMLANGCGHQFQNFIMASHVVFLWIAAVLLAICQLAIS